MKKNYYSDPDSHIRDKIKIVIDLSNYATWKELKDAAEVDTSSLVAKRSSLLWKLKLTS